MKRFQALFTMLMSLVVLSILFWAIRDGPRELSVVRSFVELSSEEFRNIQTESKSTKSPALSEIRDNADHTTAQVTPKRTVNPAVELTLIRRTSVNKIPDQVSVECDLELSNPTSYRNNKDCCMTAKEQTLPELCGQLNASTIKNESRVKGCTCLDFMACKTVVMSAISSNHWLESLDAIASVQNTMPDMKILVMDLGMSTEQAEQLKRVRNVEVRVFPFDTFPPHVRNLQSFAWKALTMQMALSEYEVVFYMDSSIRLKCPLVDVLLPSLQSFPIRLKANGWYDGAFTREETYNYLGVTRKQVSKCFQKSGGLQLYRNCSLVHNRILSSLVDCALHQECIAPTGSSPIGCDFGSYEKQVKQIDTIDSIDYIGCHRFDMSAITSVLEREFHLSNDSPVVDPDGYEKSLVVQRKPTKCFTLYLNE